MCRSAAASSMASTAARPVRSPAAARIAALSSACSVSAISVKRSDLSVKLANTAPVDMPAAWRCRGWWRPRSRARRTAPWRPPGSSRGCAAWRAPAGWGGGIGGGLEAAEGELVHLASFQSQQKAAGGRRDIGAALACGRLGCGFDIGVRFGGHGSRHLLVGVRRPRWRRQGLGERVRRIPGRKTATGVATRFVEALPCGGPPQRQSDAVAMACGRGWKPLAMGRWRSVR